ncbi:MAG TPA: nuclear transport factor 2 family protein [Polyangiaceae bacterium]|nr:nuclear transport factor 2 family protein [Polyangiaceae bacterium]
MSRWVAVVVALASSGCAAAASSSPCTPAAPALFDRAAAERDIARALDDFHDAAAHADEARYFGHFAPEAVFLGTDMTERWDLAAFRAYAHTRFASGHGWVYHPQRRSIAFASDGTVAWFDEDLMGERAGPTRGSGVLVASGGRWLIVQYNLAFTIPNERFEDLRKVLEGKKD